MKIQKTSVRLDAFRRAKLLKCLAELIREKGGVEVKDHLQNYGKPNLQKTLYEISTPDRDEIIKANHVSYMSFKLGDYFYYIAFNDNPFFPTNFTKAPILPANTRLGVKIKEHVQEVYIDDTRLSDKYVNMSLDKNNLTGEQMKSLAEELLDEMIASRASQTACSNKTVMVPNTYNSGMHEETVREARIFELYEYESEE